MSEKTLGSIASTLGMPGGSPGRPPQAFKVERGWLVMADTDPPLFLGFPDLGVSDPASVIFVDNADKAVRFARRKDAQAAIDHYGLEKFCVPDEREWC